MSHRLGLGQVFVPSCGTYSPEGDQLFQNERGLGNWLGVKWATSSSVWMGIRVERLVEIWFPDQVSGTPEEWRFVVRRVAMFLATIKGQSANLRLREWKASSNGQCQNLTTAPCRDTRTVVPRAP